MKNKIIILITAFILVFSLMSCGEGGNNESKTNSSSESQSSEPTSENNAREEISEIIDADVEEGYMIADFESYSEIVTMSAQHTLGTLIENKDKKYIKTGEQSLGIKIVGRENDIWDSWEEPMLKLRTSSPYIQKKDYSEFNEFRLSAYNDTENDICMQFVFNDNMTQRRVFWLKSGWNEVKIDYDPLVLKETLSIGKIETFTFIFDRGVLHETQEVVYLDNFRAVRTSPMPSKINYEFKNGILAGFESENSLNYLRSHTFANTSSYQVSYGITDIAKTQGDKALRIYTKGSQIIRTDTTDQWRVSLVPQFILDTLNLDAYNDKNICLDIYNNGEETITITVYYYYETLQTLGDGNSMNIAPGQWAHFKANFNTVLQEQSWFESAGITSWTGLMLGFNVPHPDKGKNYVDLIVDNYRFEDKT